VTKIVEECITGFTQGFYPRVRMVKKHAES